MDMTTNTALLWDESFLWGLMAYKALNSNDLPFELVRSEEIKNGILKNYKTLFVPGGWASNKIKTLGDNGTKEIRSFVKNGGNYIGFCGGAGLATLDGIGLLNIKRRPTKERVPSFSGRIQLNISEHPVWNDLAENNSPVFHAWWPSQFLVEDESIKVLATYGKAMPDSFSSDMNVGDVEAKGNWPGLEAVYKIKLDPERLVGEPAVIGGLYGKGRVVLSLVHFDTPDDANGAAVLRNLWEYVGSTKARKSGNEAAVPLLRQAQDDSVMVSLSNYGLSPLINDLESSVEELISLGVRNFLWFWRNPMLLQWRRGVRGLEYCTLYVMIKEITEIIQMQHSPTIGAEAALSIQHLEIKLDEIKKLLLPFVAKAKGLLVMERLAMQNGHITYERCEDPEIKKLREELFSTSKSHGGLFKELLDETDKLLYNLLTTVDNQGQ